MDPVISAAIYGAAGAVLALFLRKVLPMWRGSRGFSVTDPGPSLFAVKRHKNWFIYKMAPNRNGHYIYKDTYDGSYWDFKEYYLLDNPLDHPNLYGFDSLDEAVDAAENICGCKLVRDSTSKHIVDKAGRHVFFRRESERRRVNVHSDDVDLDELMEAQFGDEDLSDVKLGAERTHQIANG